MTMTTAIPVEQDHDPAIVQADAPPATGLWRAGVVAALAAAVANCLVAAVARAVDVPLTIEGEQIPIPGFAVATLLCSAAGLLLAAGLKRWAPGPRVAFTWAAVALTALSFVPSLGADTGTATKVVLVATHLVAAAIVVPAIVRSLPRSR